jgi:long-chain acyl-CoA synthetase
MNLLWLILTQALRHPNRVAAVDDQRSWRYLDLVGGAMLVAEAIETQSSARNVAICLPTGGAFPMALLGAWLAGRVAVPLNYLLGRDELTYVINDSDVDTILTVPAMLEFIGGAEVIPRGVRVLDLMTLDRTGLPPLRWPPMAARDQTAVILYTSGTSGRPKGVMLSHGNLLSNVEAAIAHAKLSRLDRFLGVLPQFHSFGLTALTLVPLRVGATAFYCAKFVPRRIVSLLRRYQAAIIMAVPSMYGALLSVKDATSSDFASIRLAISGGEPLSDGVLEAFRDRFGVNIHEGYGLTETAPITNLSTPERCRRGSVGTALPGVRVVVVDDQDRPLPPGRDGEILIAGPNVMGGYYKQPEQTREVFVKLDGPTTAGAGGGTDSIFFRTGDIGRLDADGFLAVTGRKKEMLIIGGENVFPRQIEEVLNQHPCVRDSAVIGRQDGVRGEVPIAFVEIEEAKNFDEAQLRTWCRQRLAAFKVPRNIERIDLLPRSATGKILRRRLQATQGPSAATGG